MQSEIVIQPQGNEFTFLEGKALEQKPPVRVLIAGHITTPGDYLKKRFRDKIDSPESANNGVALQKVDLRSAVITVDEDKMSITLELDPENPYGGVIIGKLEYTDYLSQFQINEPKMLTREAVVKLLRFSKLLFRDADKYDDLLKAFQAFDFKAYVEASRSEDTRGNRAAAVSKKIETKLPNDFVLALPIFKGQQKEEFRVEICFDTTDATIMFWFESVELANLIEQRKIEIMTDELLPFQDFVIIRK